MPIPFEDTGKVARKKDAILSVCQDNQNRTLKIVEANDYALQILKIKKEDLSEADIRDVVPEKVREVINDNIEFEDGMQDLGDVLSKVRNFSVVDYEGVIHAMSLKILLGEPVGTMSRFNLVMRDQSIQMEMEEKRKAISESMKGYEVIDEIIGLPNRTSFLKELEMVNFLVAHKGVEACFAIAEVDDYENMLANYGKVGTSAIFRSIGQNIRANLREDDSIGIMSDKSFGVILMEAGAQNILPVLNRLRYNVSNHPVQVMDFEYPAPKISMGYCQIEKNTTLEDLIKITEQALTNAVKRGGNFCEAA